MVLPKWCRQSVWARYEQLSIKDKAVCEQRLETLIYVSALQADGLNVREAVMHAGARFGVSSTSIFNWLRMVKDSHRSDWLAALVPSFSTRGCKKDDCHPEAWEVLCSDYLRPSYPAFSACYRRVVSAAKKHGREPIPCERALRRRLDTEVPKAVQTLARSVKDKAKTLYPAQRRDRSMLHAMEAVNMDGYKLDVFVQVSWSEKPVRLYLIAIQDLLFSSLMVQKFGTESYG